MTGALTNLARSASFSRRKRSTAEPAKAPPAVTKQSSAGVVSRVIRTASFSRRSSRNSGASNREGTTSEESNTSSPRTDSRCASPDNDESDAPLSDKLAGWLLKRHTSGKTIGAQWARRYLHVNEVRGTLSMSKGPSKTASAVLPLSEIKSVTVSERSDETGPNCFVISCPPVHLTVRADSPEECRMWIRQLRLRADAWRAKSNPVVSARVAGPAEAGSAELQGASPSPSPSLPSQGHVEYESAAQQDSATLARSRSPHDDASPTAARSPNKGAGRNESFTEAHADRSAVEPRPAPSQGATDAFRPPPLPQAHLERARSLAAPSPVTSPVQREEVAASSPVERTELETVELLSGDDSDDDVDQGIERAAWGQFAQGAPPAGRAGAKPTPPSSSRALPLPRDLEAMMSSEDEEEEEQAPPPRAPPARRKPEQAQPRACLRPGRRRRRRWRRWARRRRRAAAAAACRG